MPIVKVTLADAEKALKDRDWTEFDSMTDEDIARQIAENPDAAPELNEEWFAHATLMHGDTVVRRGRPKAANPKRLVSLRLDRDIIERFRATGPGWQSRINQALRDHLPK